MAAVTHYLLGSRTKLYHYNDGWRRKFDAVHSVERIKRGFTDVYPRYRFLTTEKIMSETITTPEGEEFPIPPEGVEWPNHLHQEARYPCSTTRMKIMRDVMGGEGDYGYVDHDAYPVVLDSMNKLLTAADAYLFRQYYYRDTALIALRNGDVDEAISIISKIGSQ